MNISRGRLEAKGLKNAATVLFYPAEKFPSVSLKPYHGIKVCGLGGRSQNKPGRGNASDIWRLFHRHFHHIFEKSVLILPNESPTM